MSGGWEVGDLAVCISKDEEHWVDLTLTICNGPKNGEILKVCAIGIEPTWGTSSLHFAEYPHPECWHGTSFRKIKPDTEPCEEEFTVLIKRGRKVGADA